MDQAVGIPTIELVVKEITVRRSGNLWPKVSSFSNLVHAAWKASRGKRSHVNVARFNLNLEQELCRLQDELLAKQYAPRPYRTFEVFEPKRRLISAAPFRDRVVHHALCRVLEPLFERSFIFDSYASRPGKGVHAAVDRFTDFARRNRYVLKCDIRRFFPSIDHRLLESLVARRIKDPDVMWLVGRIVESWRTSEPADEWLPGDDLLTPLTRRRGLPIGNQTSQFFANVYLNPFDHFVKETLHARSYCRYVDDFVILDNDKRRLVDVLDRCAEFLLGLRLRLHPQKCIISRVRDGTPFLGFRVFPTHRLLGRANVRRMQRRLKWLQAAYADGSIGPVDIRRHLTGWIGHAGHADTYRLRARLFDETTFSRRVAPTLSREPVERPSGAGRVLEQQFEERPVGLPQQQPSR